MPWALLSILDFVIRHPAFALYLIAGAALLLLCIGIHNAWDTATYVTISMPKGKAGTETEA